MRTLTPEQEEALGKGFLSMLTYVIGLDSETNESAREIEDLGRTILMEADGDDAESFRRIGATVFPFIVEAVGQLTVGILLRRLVLGEDGEE